MKNIVVLVFAILCVHGVAAQSTTGPASDVAVRGVYRVYPVARLIAVQTGQTIGFVTSSVGRSADSPYFTVGISDDGVISIVDEPYRFEWVDDVPGHLKFWPANAQHRYAYPSRAWNVQPIVDPDAFVVTEYDVDLDFEDDTAIAGQILYFRKIVPGGSFSDRWIQRAETTMDLARELVDANPWY